MHHRDQTKLPYISIDAIDSIWYDTTCDKVQKNYSIEEGFGGVKLFKVDSKLENGKYIFKGFVNKNQILDIFEKMYVSQDSRNKNFLSISNDTDLCDYSQKCGLVILPEGNNGISADSYINELASMLNSLKTITNTGKIL